MGKPAVHVFERLPAGRLVAVIVGLAAVAFVVPAKIYTHAGNADPTVIHACVQRSSNQVRIVGTGGSCTNAEAPVHWSITGPQGPAGPQGESAFTALTIITDLPDVRVGSALAADQWFTIRSLPFSKGYDTSRLRITYQDTLGSKTYTYGACKWRIRLGTTVLSSFSAGDVEEGPFGHRWRMQNAAHMAWAFDVPSGDHEIAIDALRTANADECLSGYNTTGNFLSIEEIR